VGQVRGAHGDLACIGDAAWGRKVIEVDDDLGWSMEWVSWVSWRVAAMVVILVREGAVAVLR